MDGSNKLSEPEIEELEKKISALSDERNKLKKEIDDEYELIWDPEEELAAIQEEQYESSRWYDPMEERVQELSNQEFKLKLKDDELGSLERKLFLYNNSEKIDKNFLSKVEGDKLDRTMSVERLTSMIKMQDKKSSLNIGIIGEWGSGKTTFLQFLNDNLSKNVEDNIVWFNASQYEDQEQIWFSLLQRVSDKFLSSKICFKKLRFIWNSLKKNNNLYLLYSPFILLLISTGAFGYLFYTISSLINNPALFKGLDSYLVTLSVAVGAFTGTKSYQLTENFLMYMSTIIGNDKELIKNNVKYPDYKKILGNREKVRSDLEIYKKLMTKGKNSKLIIMVDELDRCSETTILSFFSSIEAFLNIPGIFFIFSINPEVVYPVVSNLVINKDKYGNEKDDKRKSGAEFIDKYIDLYFTLIPPMDFKDYVNGLLNDIDGINDNHKKSISEFINIISLREEVTPRQVKKILDISLMFHKEFIDFTFEEIVIIFFMQYYFPEFIPFILSIDMKPQTKLSHYNDSRIFMEQFRKLKEETNTNSNLDSSVLKEAIKFLKESNKISFERSKTKILRVLEYM